MQYLENQGQYSTKCSSTKVQGSLLGAGYWDGFQKRHPDKFVAQRGVQFGHHQSEWYNYEKFQKMYQVVYGVMELVGVVTKLPEAQ